MFQASYTTLLASPLTIASVPDLENHSLSPYTRATPFSPFRGRILPLQSAIHRLVFIGSNDQNANISIFVGVFHHPHIKVLHPLYDRLSH